MHRSAGILASILLGAVAWTACSESDTLTVTDPSILPAVTAQCPAGGTKTEVTDAFSTTTTTYGFVVGSICVKAGTSTFSTEHNETFGNGCYTVSGLGTNTITLSETGAAGCKDVSYFTVYPGADHSPPPSPSPSPH